MVITRRDRDQLTKFTPPPTLFLLCGVFSNM